MTINERLQSALKHHQAGNLSQAENIYKEILAEQPDNFYALHYLGLIYYQLRNFGKAVEYIKKALQLNPCDTHAHFNLGNIYKEMELLDDALKSFQKSVEYGPDNADAYNNKGLIYKEKELLDEAIVCFIKAVQFNPNHVIAWYNLGIVYKNKKLLDDAIYCLQKTLSLNPNIIEAYFNLGNIFQEKKQSDSAITFYQKALQLNPDLADAYSNLGNAFMGKGCLEEAISSYRKALQLNPDLADAYSNLGNAFMGKGCLEEAISSYRKALQLNPDLADAYSNLGNAFKEKGRLDEFVISCYRKALEINPDHAEAFSQLTHQLQHTCNWQELGVMEAKLDVLTKKALATQTKPAETPFMSIVRKADLSVNFAVAEAWSRDISRAMSSLGIHFSYDAGRIGKTKIVIGYLSNDFGNHATAHLMLSLFGLHNREEFEIICYSYGKDDGSYYSARIRHDCDKFVDIAGLSYDAAARRIHGDKVDILVDLKGYTRGNRLAICALRPAPVQVSYLGFPGTTGSDFFDYIISDSIVTPKEHSTYYTEKFIYMPHCYQVNNHLQTISNREWKKEHFGLPESCFVFCSFNQPYKIDPVIFDSWMRILRQVPESILWLGFRNTIVEQNLKRAAETRSVKSERLIFADTLIKDEHLSRLRFADLALDTRIYNGHTTTSDALWAGVPVIALQGGHFASRVSSSILYAMWLPELVTNSIEEYEALAVQLANNPVELKEIRHRIAENRMKAPLFDTRRFVKNLETAYREIWKIYLAGEAPRQIEALAS